MLVIEWFCLKIWNMKSKSNQIEMFFFLRNVWVIEWKSNLEKLSTICQAH